MPTSDQPATQVSSINDVTRLVIRKPDDCHVHLRDGSLLTAVVNHTARQFARAIFLGTDSAPHVVGEKESACGCAGIFNAPVALETYAAVFEEEGALDSLEAFASEHGPHFYGLPLNESRIVIERTAWRAPQSIATANTRIVPFQAGAELAWRYKGSINENKIERAEHD